MGAIQQALLDAAGVIRDLVENFNGPALNSDWDGSGGTYTFKGKEFVTWNGKVNVTETTRATLTKSGGALAWDAGAYSSQSVGSGDIRVEATIRNAAGGVLIGISNTTDAAATSDDANIDFCLVAFAGTLYKQENGSAVSTGITCVNGDRIGVEVKSGAVHYLKNGVTIAANASPTLNYPLCADCSIRDTSGGLENCKLQTPGSANSFIDITAGDVKSVQTNRDFTGKTITIHCESEAQGDWFLVVGDIAGSTYLIEIRYQPSLGKIRLTQHSGGTDTHHDYVYTVPSDVEWVQMVHTGTGGSQFLLLVSSDGITFNQVQATLVAGGFPLTTVGVDIPYISGVVQLESFDSNITL